MDWLRAGVAIAHDTADDETGRYGGRGDAEGQGADAEDERHTECSEDATAKERLVEQLFVSVAHSGACGVRRLCHLGEDEPGRDVSLRLAVIGYAAVEPVGGEEPRPQPEQPCHAPPNGEGGEDHDARDICAQGAEDNVPIAAATRMSREQVRDVGDGATLDEALVVGPRQQQMDDESADSVKGNCNEGDTTDDVGLGPISRSFGAIAVAIFTGLLVHPGDGAVSAREGHLDDRAGRVRKSEDWCQQEVLRPGRRSRTGRRRRHCPRSRAVRRFPIWRTDGSVLPIMMPPKTMLIINPGNADSTGIVSEGIRLQLLVSLPSTCGPASRIRNPARTLAGM
jgi:hypothetical protein